MYYDLSYSQNKTEVKKDTLKIRVFKCYPNPVEDELFILGTNKIKHIDIIDVSGKTVAHYDFSKSIIRIDVSRLKPSFYLLRVTDENNNQETKKLMVK